jgi:hypothetical protein
MREFESSPELDETEQPCILAVLAERVGFEPTVAHRATTVFETVPFNRSAPLQFPCQRLVLYPKCPPLRTIEGK